MEIGPALPPHLVKSLKADSKEKSEDEEKQCCIDRSQTKQIENKPKDNSLSDESYGPALPPGFQKKQEKVSSARVIGPMRPPQFDHPSTVTSNGLYALQI